MMTVLVVDDDPAVLAVAAEALIEEGFQVRDAGVPSEALDILRREPKIHLLITDIKLPEMTGFELADRAKRMRPKLCALYMSGALPGIPWGEHGLGHGRMVTKPWRATQLVLAVKTALFGGGPVQGSLN